MLKIITENGKRIRVDVTRTNVTIYDSYKITDEHEMKMILSKISLCDGYNLTRSRKDLLNEWKCHNLAYQLKIFRNRTKDTDLNEYENKFRLLLYKIVGRFM